MVEFPLPRIVQDVNCDAGSDKGDYSKADLQLSNISLGPDTWHTVLLVETTVASALSADSDSFSTPRDPKISYRIADAAPSCGLGVFAAVDIPRGGLIVRERPLLIYPQAVPFHKSLPPENGYPELDDAVSRMSPHRQAAFLELMNNQPAEPSLVKGIIDTNGLYLGSLPGRVVHQYAAVCKDVSRVNHSCSPNATYRFDIHTFTVELRALFPIPAGEQIFISYIDPGLRREDRQQELSSYRFTCACPPCSQTGHARMQSEIRRHMITRGDGDANARDAALERWMCTRSMPADHSDRQYDRDFLQLFERERLYYEPVWEAFAARVCKACCALADLEGAKKVAKLAAELNVAYTGDDRGWAAVEAAPEQTELWNSRAKLSHSARDAE